MSLSVSFDAARSAIWRSCALLLVLCTMTGCQTTTQPKSVPPAEARDVPTGQLPREVMPGHYDLHLWIDPREADFRGEVEIALEFASQQSIFWLHGRDLEIDALEFIADNGKKIAAQTSLVDSTGVLQVQLAQPFGPGRGHLKARYHAPFNHALEGLYKVEEGGESYAFTQFESISARLAFPGFDEPSFKVPFDVCLTVPAAYHAIANTPAVREVFHEDGSKSVIFATSKPIPTYLAAFAVGPFDVVPAADIPPSEIRDRPVPLRGIAVKGKGPQLAYALEHTASIVQALENYFGIAYPYAKLDILAVPDFNAGAMENVGAITYREILLLMDESATPQQIRSYKGVHAHELAHQWFGNLVTPVWWDDIWLNEAFATWMGNAALDLRDPKDLFRRDLLASSARTMVTDSLASARQIRQPILSSHDIASAFDGITYRKGGGVLSMFERYLGFDAFRAGVSSYLKSRSWGNATADDFINTIAQQAPAGQQEDIAAAFQSFIQQPGLPVLETDYNCATLGNEPIFQVRLIQHRYLPLGSDANFHQQWKIPACIAYGQGGERQEACRLLDQPKTLWLFRGECPDWVLPNAQGAGYYRWNYPQGGWESLLAAAAELSPEEQLKLADSFVAAYQAGGVDLAEFLDGAHMLAQLPTRQAVVMAMDELEEIISSWHGQNGNIAADRVKAGLREIYAPALDALGLDAQDDYDLAKYQYELVSFQALVVDDGALRQELLSQAATYLNVTDRSWTGGVPQANALNLSLMELALEVAVEEWGEPVVQMLMQGLTDNQDPSWRDRAVTGLAAARGEVAEQVLDFLLKPALRNNEVPGILFSLISAEETRELAWHWLQREFNGLLQRMPRWAQGRLASVGSKFCSAPERAELDAFFRPRINDLGGGPRSLANTLERIDLCVAQREHYADQFQQLFAR